MRILLPFILLLFTVISCEDEDDNSSDKNKIDYNETNLGEDIDIDDI